LIIGTFLVAATFKLRNCYTSQRRLKPAATKIEVCVQALFSKDSRAAQNDLRSSRGKIRG